MKILPIQVANSNGTLSTTGIVNGIGYARDLGMRLDIVAVDRALADRLDTTWIDHVERSAHRPSDHAALVADFRLTNGASS